MLIHDRKIPPTTAAQQPPRPARARQWTVMLACSLLLVGALAGLRAPAAARGVGTDLAGLNLCLYGDCEARGAYTADPYGWPNPATLPVGTLPYIERAAFVSSSHSFVAAGDVSADVSSLTATAAFAPVLFQVNAARAKGAGRLRNEPDLRLSLDIPVVRLAAAADLAPAGVPGLSVGLIGAIPVRSSRIALQVPEHGLELVRVRQRREVDITAGVHWRGGAHDWFSAGASLQAQRFADTANVLDPATFEVHPSRASTNAWFARLGVSLLPAFAFGTPGTDPLGEWLRELRVAADLEHRNITVPGEGTKRTEVGYLGADLRLLPDAWNPVSPFARFHLVAGIDMLPGWGVGPAIYGNGPLRWLSIQFAHSSRRLAPTLGRRVENWVVGASVVIPLQEVGHE